MWKQIIKFQTTIIRHEKSQILYSSNIHKIPELKRIWFVSRMFFRIPKKPAVLSIGGLQIALKKKAFVLLSKRPNITLKIQKRQPVGAKVALNKKQSFMFLYFLVFNLFPQLDLINFLKLRKDKRIFNFYLNSTEIMKNLILLNSYSMVNPKMQINLMCHPKKQTGKFLWRLLKIPVK